MKIPSLIRLPKYKRFNLEPRYYDPIKDDVDHRVKRIQYDMGQNENAHRSSISGAFTRNLEKREKSSSLLQILIIFVLLGTFAAYLYYGNVVFYFFITLIPVYLYYRSKKFLRPRK
jgi:hypothetical protein